MSPLSASEAGLIESIDPAPILSRTLDWAGVNSGTANLGGVAEMARRLTDAFGLLPGAVTLEPPAPVEQVLADGATAPVAYGEHFVLRVRPEAERRVLLTGHMDTVFATTHPFQESRWLDDTTLNGPGTADMKGGLSLMLAGLLAFEATGPALGYDVMINSDEETGSKSSAPLIAGLAEGKLAALTYEPALPGGVMARARPGSGNFALVVRGRSAHAGRNPEDGRNALVAAADLAQRLYGIRRPGLTVNPARIEGGAPNNMVPDLAVLHVNLRPGGAFHLAEAEGLMARAIADVTRTHEVTIEAHGGFNRPPKPITPKSEALFALVRQAASDLGDAMHWKDTGGVCDGNNIAACGVPVIDTMGALGGAIHSPDEFLDVPSLGARARLTALVLHRIDQGGFA
jgi:glutamate carboxypeptidase